MGSQLSAMAPTSVYPVEHYLTELSSSEHLSFDHSLGSTRFFKVARVRIRGQTSALAVAKVFVIPDLGLPIRKYKDRLDKLKDQLTGNPNALPFTRIILTDKTGILLRQFGKYSLYDRLSTRPFLTMFEKKWIAFQLLKCFQWIHRQELTHGDLKLENILVTSGLWVLVTDFAVFKPTLLPEDNPSEFSFFFDTSRRRTCNLAPERFVSEDFLSSASAGAPASPGVDLSGSASCTKVTAQMDLFSLGCVLAELFSDSADFQLFDLSNILTYKNRNLKDVRERIESVISDPPVRDMISNLISQDPEMRNSTTQHLMELTPSVFPNCFNTLFDYFKDLINLSPDGKIVRLECDLSSLIGSVTEESPHGLLLILVQLTSNMRSLKHVHAKITCLKLVCQVVEADRSLMSGYVLDRILPYLLAMTSDPISPCVRRQAVESLTYALSVVEGVGASDNNVFIDYILPVLVKVAADRSPFVRMSLASNLGSLAETSMRFLQTSNFSSQALRGYEEEMVKMFQEMISHLLTDPANEVKRVLLDTDVSKLCVFLGRAKTNDVILSHIITFLNDKDDFELRSSFFDNIVPIAAYLGSQSSSILRPLLQQGLSDSEEFVIHRTLSALSALTEMKFLDQTLILDLMAESAPLLSHPNPWIRHSMLSFLITLSSNLSLAETHCKLMPLVRRHLTRNIHVLTPDLVFEYLRPTVSRALFSLILGKSTPPAVVESLIGILREQQLLRSLATRHHHHREPQIASASTSSPHQQAASLYHKLKENGLTEEAEDQLVDMADIIIRISRNRSRSVSSMKQQMMKKSHRRIGSNSSVQSEKPVDPSLITVESKTNTNRVRVQSVALIDDEKLVTTRIRSLTMSNMNDEWKHMFGSMFKDTGESSTTTICMDSVMDPNIMVPIAHEAHEYEPCPPCGRDLGLLINHKKDSYELCLWSRGIDLGSGIPERKSLTAGERVVHCPTVCRPRGCLVAHLHEHLKAVNRLVPLYGTSLFASCSSDGYIKTWDAVKMESAKMAINRSSQSVASNDLTGFDAITYCHSMDTLIGVTSKSVVQLFKVDCSSSKLRLLQVHDYHAAATSDMPSSLAPEITDVTSSAPFTFMASLSNSSLCGFDLRTAISVPTFQLRIDMRDGFITCITGTEYCVFAATSSGAIYTFDTRFLMKANLVRYNDRKRVRRLLYTPLGLFSAVKSNNEVTLFDCETGFRQKTLWASKAPILSSHGSNNTPPPPDSVLSMLYLSNSRDASSSCLLTAGTDMRIRVWDLNCAEKSYVMSDGLRNQHMQQQRSRPQSLGDRTFSYKSKIVDAIQVLAEEELRFPAGSSSQQAADLNTVSSAHHDSISDMVWMEQCNLLVSGSRDGVIKLWK